MIIMMIVYMLLTILPQLLQCHLEVKALKCTNTFNDNGLEKSQFNKFEKVLSESFSQKVR